MAEKRTTWDGFHCMDCGYDLTGIESAHCPECGHELIAGGLDLSVAREDAARHARRLSGCCLVGLVLGCLQMLVDPEAIIVAFFFVIIYSFFTAIAVVIIGVISTGCAKRHERSRTRLVWSSSVGWCFWPVAVVPPSVGVAILAFDPRPGLVLLFLLLLGGLIGFVQAWHRALRGLGLSPWSSALLLQLVSVLGASLAGTLLFLFALAA
jgi:hypothetical protein